MKNLVNLTVIGISLLLASCTKKPLCCVLPAPPTVTAQKNGEAWLLPIIKSSVDDQHHIFISTAGPYLLNSAKDSLSISLTYTGLGGYSPTDEQVAYTVFANGVKTRYLLDSNFYNTIYISEYAVQHNPSTMNPDPTEMKATFNLRFTDPTHTTYVSLMNGKFTVYLSN